MGGPSFQTQQLALRIALWIALPALYLVGVWWAFERTPAPGLQILQQAIWIGFVLALGAWPRLADARLQDGVKQEGGVKQGSVAWLPLLALWLGGLLVYAASEQTRGAWLVLGSSYALLLAVDQRLARGRGWLLRALIHLTTLGGGALWAITLGQLETGFADEEFFVAVQMLVLLGLLALLLLAAYRIAHALIPRTPARAPQIIARLHGAWIAGWLALLGGALPAVLLWSYANSFYPQSAPEPYPGISAESPFLCATLDAAPVREPAYSSEQIFADYLAQVAENPYKGPPELAMLALGTRDAEWAEAFRAELLAEAAAGRFTDPAHSIKSVQHGAAQRIYYTAAMRQAFPDLFSADDMAALETWFAAINRRAHTIEWVDWMYALAFWKAPEGPYENQESGAGLLAMLEWTGWADPGAQPANVDYLARNPRGWLQRFRNTDDAYIYQLEWLTNAWFQQLYRATDSDAAETNRRLAYDWLALQLLPNGAAPYYNHVGRPSVAGSLALGADLLDDPRLLWLAGHALEQSRAPESYFGERLHYAQPGLERAPDVAPLPPKTGSCLLYGDSGLPNQRGPIAPDKIVFRDGWHAGANYLLLNLRFTGWHRYKATNAVAFVYNGDLHNGDLDVADAASRNPYAWLPAGRSLFRDKRVPRENLSGLLIPNSGMSALLYRLTGVGSPFAQDPPAYAQVLAFETSAETGAETSPDRDYSHTRLTAWRRWSHDREIHFIHQGPIVIVDHASGPPEETAALGWQFTHAVERVPIGEESNADLPGAARLRLGDSAAAPQVLFVSLSTATTGELSLLTSPEGAVEARHRAAKGGALALATVFLPGEWAGATVTRQGSGAETVLRITAHARQVEIPLAE